MVTAKDKVKVCTWSEDMLLDKGYKLVGIFPESAMDIASTFVEFYEEVVVRSCGDDFEEIWAKNALREIK